MKYNEIRPVGSENPVSHLLDGERGVYKLVYETASENYIGLHAEEIAKLEDDLTTALGTKLPALKLRPGELVIDIPMPERGITEEDLQTVYVYDDSGYTPGRVLLELSQNVRNIRSNRSKVCRVFISRSAIARVPIDQISNTVRGALGH